MKEKKKITLRSEHRGISSSTFTGRPQGEQIRGELNLDTIDLNSEQYIVSIPENTTSFNPSFYLGLFFDSIKKLGGLNNFKEKYTLKVSDENSKMKASIEGDIYECERQANNEYLGKTGLDF